MRLNYITTLLKEEETRIKEFDGKISDKPF